MKNKLLFLGTFFILSPAGLYSMQGRTDDPMELEYNPTLQRRFLKAPRKKTNNRQSIVNEIINYAQQDPNTCNHEYRKYIQESKKHRLRRKSN